MQRRERKYPGRLASFAEELFSYRKIDESVCIPFSRIEPLMSGQRGNRLDVTRRAFCAYIAIRLGKNQRDVCTGKPSLIYQSCDFSKKDFAVKVTKKKDLKDFILV